MYFHDLVLSLAEHNLMIPWHWPRHHEIKKNGGKCHKTLMPKRELGEVGPRVKALQQDKNGS